MDRKYNGAYSDCRRFAKIISDNLAADKIKEIDEQEDILEKPNLMDDD